MQILSFRAVPLFCGCQIPRPTLSDSLDCSPGQVIDSKVDELLGKNVLKVLQVPPVSLFIGLAAFDAVMFDDLMLS